MAKEVSFSEVKEESNNMLWRIFPQKWFSSYPFYFVVKYPRQIDLVEAIMGETNEIARFYLPCPPQSMTVQDMSTSDAYATLGGVVEETSTPVFTNVILTGTTGMALNDQSGMGVANMVRQRKLFSEATGGTNVLSRLGQNVIGALEGVVQGITGNAEPALPFANYGSAVYTPDNDSPVSQFFSGRGMDEASAFAKLGAFIPGLGPETRAQTFTNGFSWGIALRQFLLRYATTKAKYSDLELYFVDEKRNTQSRCVVRSPQFQNVAGQPMIQSYTIYLKCWDTKDIEGKTTGPVDRLETDLKNVETLNAASAILSVAKTIRKLRRPLDLAGSMASQTIGSKLSG